MSHNETWSKLQYGWTKTKATRQNGKCPTQTQIQIHISNTMRHQSFSTKKRTQTVPAFQINQHHKSLLWLGKALYTLAAFRQAAARQRHGAPTPLSNVWPVAGFATMSNRHRFRRS